MKSNIRFNPANILFYLMVIFFSFATSCKKSKTDDDKLTGDDKQVQQTKQENHNKIEVGSKIYVHANNGLVLRKSPSKDGEKITTLNKDGKPLMVLELPDINNQYTAEKIGDFELRGGWIKVKTIDGKEGYVFEGYVSKYPPIVDFAIYENSLIEGFYKNVSPPKGKPVALPKQEGLNEGYEQAFEDGALFHFEYWDGGATHIFKIPQSSLSFSEAFVILRSLLFIGNTKSEYDSKMKKITVNDEEGYVNMHIQLTNDTLKIEYFAAD